MKHKLIIDGNAVYELDLKCAAKKAGKKTVKTNKEKNRLRLFSSPSSQS